MRAALDLCVRLSNRRRPVPKSAGRFWYPNYWHEVSPLYSLDRNEGMLCEVGERAADCHEPGPCVEALRLTGYFGWAADMQSRKGVTWSGRKG